MEDDERGARNERHGRLRSGDEHHGMPVTAEVGGEGGSYADATRQVATFDEDIERIEGRGGDAGDYANRRAEIAGGGPSPGQEPAHGMIRYPTEDASVPVGPLGADANRNAENRRSAPNWRGGLIGAAAGLAGAALVGGLARRRRSP
jgi:hypothetical protein